MPGFPLPGVAEPGWPAPGFPLAGSLLLVGPVFGCSAVVFTPVLLPLCRRPGRLARALKGLPDASAGLYVQLSAKRAPAPHPAVGEVGQRGVSVTQGVGGSSRCQP